MHFYGSFFHQFIIHTYFLPITTSPFLSVCFPSCLFCFAIKSIEKIIYVCVLWNGEWEKAIKYRNYCVIMQKSLLYHHFHQIIPGLCVYTMHIPIFYYKLFDFFIMPVYSVFVQNLSLTFFVLFWFFLVLSLSDGLDGSSYFSHCLIVFSDGVIRSLLLLLPVGSPFLSTWLFPTWPPFHFEHELNNQQKPTGILIFNSSHKNYYIVSW